MSSEIPPLTVGAVIVAAGRSSRMGGVDKTFAPLLGSPLIAHTVERFEAHPRVGEIALVLAAESVKRGRELAESLGWSKVTQVCPGGVRRQDSVYNGLAALSSCDLVMVHDGARPCLDCRHAGAGHPSRRRTRRGGGRHSGQGHHQARVARPAN